MEYSSILVILIMAFSVGMVHALDADHVIAVSSLARHKKSVRSSIYFCLNWTIGHSLTLLIVGFAVFVLGMAVPETMSTWAEFLVGIMLILIGVGVFYDLRRKKAHLHFHQHGDERPHAHWHTHQNEHNNEHSETHHRAIMVGVLHGAAGSAPLIAILPFTIVSSPWLAITYLALFSVGVFAAMLVVGGVIGSVFKYLNHGAEKLIRYFAIALGSTSILFGGLLLNSVVPT